LEIRKEYSNAEALRKRRNAENFFAHRRLAVFHPHSTFTSAILRVLRASAFIWPYSFLSNQQNSIEAAKALVIGCIITLKERAL